MTEKGLSAETVALPHGTVGHWFGKKDAKNVLVYYHGMPICPPALSTTNTSIYTIPQYLHTIN